MRWIYLSGMHRSPLQTLVHLVATEENPHQLIIKIVADSVLLKEVQRLCRKMSVAATPNDVSITERCISSHIPPDYFLERLQLIARIINLFPYEQTYYEILGINPSASTQEVKQAFRRLSFSCHPDINPDDARAAERFRNIQHSYEVLSNDMLRQSYDQNLTRHIWNEEKIIKGGSLTVRGWQKWRRIWPFTAFFALFLLMIMVFDLIGSLRWQTERHSRGTKALQEIPVATTQALMAMKEQDSLDVERKIREFIKRFSIAYEAKDPAAFLPFFEDDAIENGRPIKELIPFYEANFRRPERLRYRIQVRRWEARDGEVMVDGNYSLSIQAGQEAPVESTGPIEMTLTPRDANDYGVKRLNYSIKEWRKSQQ